MGCGLFYFHVNRLFVKNTLYIAYKERRYSLRHTSFRSCVNFILLTEGGVGMKKVEAIIRDEKLSAVKESLKDIGIGGMTITEVRGHGTQKGVTEVYRGRSFSVDLLPKIKVELVVDDKDLQTVTNAITDVARTGSIGDGKIFIYDVIEIIRIRTGEKGTSAV